MSNRFRECGALAERLRDSVVSLAEQASILQLPPLAEREWYELLTRKLLPQLTDDAFLVVAVVGGTNIGKSVVFNHIAGCRASSTSPLASGTKHPVCLIPEGFAASHDLAGIFPGFELYEWSDSDAALEECDEDRLFWRTSSGTAENLLILDTPDIDSDARINWHRADNIRRCADVLIAILTQQKYNDAAVKQFFRKAAEEDKAVIIVFNQCQLPQDEEYWPLWVKTFCDETGIQPEYLYLAPIDRSAAEENRLSFLPRAWPPNEDECGVDEEQGRVLANDLSSLRFEEIKIRTLEGSLARLLEETAGVPAFLNEIRHRSDEFRSAAELLATHRMAVVDDWPSLPNSVLIHEIRHWWQGQRQGWSRNIHGFYNTIGQGIGWVVRAADEKLRGPKIPPIERYRKKEWEVILTTVENIYEKLTWFHQLGNELLEPRLKAILGGTSRSELLRCLEAAHREVNIEEELRTLVGREMDSLRQESPQFYSLLKRLDSAAAAARPAVSVALMCTGFLGPASDVAGQMVVDSLAQSAIHVAGDVATGTAAAAVGDTALSTTASTGMSLVQAKLQRMHANFAAGRAGWLSSLLKEHLLGSLPDELQLAATLPQQSVFSEVQQVLGQLRSRISENSAEPVASGERSA